MNWNASLSVLLFFFFFFAEWTENALQKSHSVNMCIIIHSSGRIVCLLWPHFQRAQKQAGGVGSSEQRPFFPTRLGLRNAHHSAGTEPFTGLLAAHEWQLNHRELFPSTGAGWLHYKNISAKLKYISLKRKLKQLKFCIRRCVRGT